MRNNDGIHNCRFFKKIGIIGSGIMGAGIAAQVANAKVDCLLLDIPFKNVDNSNKHKLRNKIVEDNLQKALKLKPALFYSKNAFNRISIGNIEDDFNELSSCDWIIEVVTEKLDVKRKIFSKLDCELLSNVIISSNTSGLSMVSMLQGRSMSFKKRFLITHFFNPVRYLYLLEVVKSDIISNDIVSKIVGFSKNVLGKGVVFAKDTPNFIANRIGIFSMMKIMNMMKKNNYCIEEIDLIFGELLGRPKSAIFRTADIVGIDTLMHVTNNCYDNLKNDSQRNIFICPKFIIDMIDRGFLGQKTKQGFYKKIDKEIRVLDLTNMEYKFKKSLKLESVKEANKIKNISKRLKYLISLDNKIGIIVFKMISEVCIYSAEILEDIAETILDIDNAIKWGFGWDIGPFEMWDAIGVKDMIPRMIKNGFNIPRWVSKMLDNKIFNFYKYDIDAHSLMYYNIKENKMLPVYTTKNIYNFDILQKNKSNIVKETFSTNLIDLGDGILSCMFKTKMNSIDNYVIEDINHAIDLCENGKFDGLVLSNNGKNFSVGANLLLLYMAIQQQAWDQISEMIINFQKLCMRLKYSNIPTLSAPFNLTLGGGAELVLWSNKVRSHAELYMGLVEIGVGLIPAAGGNVEMLARTLSKVIDSSTYSVEPLIQRVFEIIVMCKISISADEAKQYLYLHESDMIIMNKNDLLKSAKYEVLGMASSGFTPPDKRSFRLPGSSALAMFEMVLKNMLYGKYISNHDFKIAKKLAYVMTGGNTVSTYKVDEQYVLDLEREAFLSLCGEVKTQERIEFMLKHNKPLRN